MTTNVFVFTGNLAKDPVLIQRDGVKRCSIQLIQNRYQGTDKATNQRREDKVISCFFSAFDGQAQFLVDNFFTGDQLTVTAHYESWSRDSREPGGQKEYGHTFTIHEIAPAGSISEKRRALIESRRAANGNGNGANDGNGGYDDDQESRF